MSTAEIIGIIVTVSLAATSGISAIIMSIIKSMFSRFIAQMDLRFDKLETVNKEISNELTTFKLDVEKSYVRAERFETLEEHNDASHSKIHTRLDKLSEELTRVAERQKVCKGCNQ